ncbi:MAG TPA: hypothetical protein VIV11_19480, partial [Kofleriaceae bacterium]
MSVRASLLAVLAGCSFERGTAAGDGAVADMMLGDGTGTDGTSGDGPPTDASGLCGGKVWFADFSGDPTTYNNNGDSVNDFRARNGTFPTSQLMSGEWRVPSAGITPLDMQPFQ